MKDAHGGERNVPVASPMHAACMLFALPVQPCGAHWMGAADAFSGELAGHQRDMQAEALHAHVDASHGPDKARQLAVNPPFDSPICARTPFQPAAKRLRRLPTSKRACTVCVHACGVAQGPGAYYPSTALSSRVPVGARSAEQE